MRIHTFSNKRQPGSNLGQTACRGMVATLLGVGLAATGAAFPASAAETAPAAVAAVAGTYAFTAGNKDANTGASLCLDADANVGAGARVSTVNCNGSTYQQWQIGTVGSQTVWINGGHPGLALASTSVSVGASMVLKPVSGTDVSQFFRWYGTAENGYAIVNPVSSPALCLDAVYAGGIAQNGRGVALAAYQGLTNQAWYGQFVG